MAAARNTATRDQHRAAIRRHRPPCGICEREIDYSLPHTDPASFVVDHIIPLNSARTPEQRTALDVLANKQAAHRACNRAKSDKTPDQLAATGPRTFVTERTW